MTAVAFEGEHRVDQMLEHLGPGDGTVLRHVSDQKERKPLALRQVDQPPGDLTDLRDAPRRRCDLAGLDRLDRIDHGDVGRVFS